MADSTHSFSPRMVRPDARALPVDGPVNVGDAERWLSLLGGGLLALSTMRRSLGTVGLLCGAGALLYRGLTGQCALYRAMGVSTVSAPQPELRRAWRFFQGHDTQRVDAHTRKPARAQAWYAEPADYESNVLYSEPFATRAEAAAWAHAEEQRQAQEHIEV